ncbi:hypothetical protein HPP92_021077 [Vanilla planifolia]|uniref:24-methylenesterol C-methyltransferase n=1 Tax=Vanilla planifolia TaxID=51239 RepID=A0A835UH80_VANPL|nr:hypothetical protein HPP92_021077 [Vanilla planifolia]
METVALLCWTAVVAAGVLYWFVWVMGAAEVKGKRAVDLKMGSISRDKVQDNYKQYWSFFRRPKETVESSEKVPDLVDTFYNLVTDIYEWGWGQSFHFSPSVPGRSHRDATRLHEERVVDLIGATTSQRILDVGCGVGGPMRAIAARSGSRVVGITINEYQVGRARAHNRKAGLDGVCEVICGNFLQMPFDDSSFDGAYSIEATCHAPRLEDVYGEIYRVLKPGGLYVSYEWVTTGLYRPEDPGHVETIQGIERGCPSGATGAGPDRCRGSGGGFRGGGGKRSRAATGGAVVEPAQDGANRVLEKSHTGIDHDGAPHRAKGGR